MVFLRAKNAGAAALRMLIWTPDIWFIIDFGLMKPGTKDLHYYVKTDIRKKEGVKTYTKSAQVRFFEKKSCENQSIG